MACLKGKAMVKSRVWSTKNKVWMFNSRVWRGWRVGRFLLSFKRQVNKEQSQRLEISESTTGSEKEWIYCLYLGHPKGLKLCY